MKLIGWRIVPEQKASAAFSGEGARLYGGRWNSIGTPMVYASEHQSLAALEVRVHIDTTRHLRKYKCFAFHFDDGLLDKLRSNLLPRNWREEPPSPSLQQIGDDWARSGNSVILAVPSAIIPDEFNYVINPRHPNFSKLKIDSPSDFAFDQRLFK